ncbi:hypothetical protein [Nesterenkonia ebinurensis]|uniref:hypothetical protein n=1 Tax=Nesterenkonia ebinurensis TaxID=2608252 RepID=UPI00123C7B7B|nr:hypothetical protein [Nesterenkonia ebinurensis]
MTSEQPPSDLIAFYSRGRDEQWQQKKRENYRKWRRRTIAITATVAVGGFVTLSVVYNMHREWGIIDALGLTCGEYVHIGEPSQAEQPFHSWQEHLAYVAEQSSDQTEALETAAEAVAEDISAVPVLGAYRGPVPTAREFSAAVFGEELIIGHHDEMWSGTDRVSVLDPDTAEISFTAETVHPTRDHDLADDARRRVLYGIGAAGTHIILQTPTYHGNTDVVIIDRAEGHETDCLRLDGGIDTSQFLSEHPEETGAWPQVLNLNAGQVGETEFLIHHGHSPETRHQLSRVDIATTEAGEPQEVEPLPGTDTELEVPEEVVAQIGTEGLRLDSVGEEHYLLSWEAGYIIFQSD